ncbi:MAG: altronate dehydratase, partial [Sediminibacterium sp.]|nr:altronate dehydratase [Sediminibacterium sp.]
MRNQVLQVHENDNVLVALVDLPAQTQVVFQHASYQLVELIPAKHKFFMLDMLAGEEVYMYGVLIGKTRVAIKKGQRVSTDNVSHAAQPYNRKPYTFQWQPPDVSRFANRTFNGYHRSDGRVGTANYWLFIPTVFCENRNLDVIKEALHHKLGYAVSDKYSKYTQSLLEAYQNGESVNNINFSPSNTPQKNRVFKNVDGIKFLNHNGGCGGTRQDASTLSKLLAAYADHANV